MSARGTSNSNARGNSKDRERRRKWLVETYRANQNALVVAIELSDGQVFSGIEGCWYDRGDPACRCYRCGVLLTVDTVTVDRIIPGIEGGTYRRDNIRPACDKCNSSTGGKLGAVRLNARTGRSSKEDDR